MGVSQYLRYDWRARIACVYLCEPVRVHGFHGIGLFHASQQFVAFDRSRYAGVSTGHCLWNVSIYTFANSVAVSSACFFLFHRVFSFCLKKYRDLKITHFFVRRAQSVQNLGLAVVSILAGVIVDKGGYLMLEMFFLGWLWGEYFLLNLRNLSDVELSRRRRNLAIK